MDGLETDHVPGEKLESIHCSDKPTKECFFIISIDSLAHSTWTHCYWTETSGKHIKTSTILFQSFFCCWIHNGCIWFTSFLGNYTTFMFDCDVIQRILFAIVFFSLSLFVEFWSKSDDCRCECRPLNGCIHALTAVPIYIASLFSFHAEQKRKEKHGIYIEPSIHRFTTLDG